MESPLPGYYQSLKGVKRTKFNLCVSHQKIDNISAKNEKIARVHRKRFFGQFLKLYIFCFVVATCIHM